MLPRFETANVGPIFEHRVSKRVANSFYANKFCLFTQDEALQRALWRAESSRRTILDAKHKQDVEQIATKLGFKIDKSVILNSYIKRGKL